MVVVVVAAVPINRKQSTKHQTTKGTKTYEDPEKAAAEPTEARRATAENFMVVSWCILFVGIDGLERL